MGLESPSRPAVTFRRARAEDVPAIVRLLADDPLGRTRERDETPLPASYAAAFAAIDADANQELVVASRGPRVVGVLQLTYLPSLTYQGAWRAQIEGVRVAARRSSSSPPTRAGPTRAASTRRSASSPPTRA